MNSMAMTIGEKIRDERLFQEYSLDELSQASGVNLDTLKKIEDDIHYPYAIELDCILYALRKPLLWVNGNTLPAFEVRRALLAETDNGMLLGYELQNGEMVKVGDFMKVGERIKSLRQENRLSIGELASSSDIPMNVLQDIESGALFPSAGQIDRLRKSLTQLKKRD